jgi:deoxyribose-phosphate aldolase
MLTKEQFAKMQDHSILEPYATIEQIKNCCEETLKYGFAATYVNPSFVSYAKSIIGDKAMVGIPIGFPFGANTTKIKIAEALEGIENGADKLDIVSNINKIKSGDFIYVENELKEFCKVVKAKKPNIIVTVIIETCFLTHDEKVRACEIVRDSGADFIKTSTGTGPRGANIGDIRLMRKVCGNKVKIKAAALFTGIEDVLAIIEEGASVIGDNSAIRWMEEWDKQLWFD